MNDAIKKMLEPENYTILGVPGLHGTEMTKLEDFLRLKRGFEKLMEQRQELIEICRLNPMIDDVVPDDVELEKAMRGEV